MWAILQAAPLTDVEWISRAGVVGILAFSVIAFLRGWVVSGRAYEEVRSERDRALDLVYRQAGIAHRAVDLSAKQLETERFVLETERLALEAELSVLRKKTGSDI